MSLHLVMEVDGPSHGDAEQAAFDAKRTAGLERWGVARIANVDVYAGATGSTIFSIARFSRPMS